MRPVAPALLLALLATGAAASPPLFIETVVGGGPDNRPALDANIYGPTAVAVEADGDLLIASSGHDRIYRVDPQGMLTIFAGTSHKGFGGDGGPAVDAHFNGLWDIVLDATGSLYVVDGGYYFNPPDPQPFPVILGNRRIRRIDAATGTITTVAGGGGGPTPATQARFGLLTAASLDEAGHLFFLEHDRGDFLGAAYRVDLATGALSRVAGGGSLPPSQSDGGPATDAYMEQPIDLAADAAGNLYIADTLNGRVRRVDAATGIITTVAGGGNQTGDGIPATSARIFPTAVTLDPDGNLLVQDALSGVVRKVDLVSGIISTPGLPISGRPAFDSGGNIYAAQNPNLVVRRDAATGQVSTVAGNGVGGAGGDGGPAIEGSLLQPVDVVFDAAGDLIIADSGNGRLRRVQRGSGVLSTLPVGGVIGSTGSLFGAGDLVINRTGDLFFTHGSLDGNQSPHAVFHRDAATGLMSVYAGGGGDLDDDIPATDAYLHVPQGLALDSAGNLFIAQYWFNVVRKVDAATRTITTIAGTAGQEGSTGDGGPATEARLGRPYRLAVDRDDNLYILDTLNASIRRVDAASGIITTVASTGPGTIDFAIDQDGSFVMLGSSRIHRFDPATGIVETIAGTGVSGYSGDGGAALDAALTGQGLAISPFGSIHLAATNSNRIRGLSACAVDLAPPSLTLALNTRRLQPSNHKMIPILVTPTGSDDCGTPLVRLVSITSNEPDDAPGNADGNTTGDIQEADFGTSDFEFLLRAERSREGTGRVYAVTYEAMDESGKVTTAQATVHVPLRRQSLLPPEEP